MASTPGFKYRIGSWRQFYVKGEIYWNRTTTPLFPPASLDVRVERRRRRRDAAVEERDGERKRTGLRQCQHRSRNSSSNVRLIDGIPRARTQSHQREIPGWKSLSDIFPFLRFSTDNYKQIERSIRKRLTIFRKKFIYVYMFYIDIFFNPFFL